MSKKNGKDGGDLLVVVNWVFTLFAIIPCKPKLKLINPTPTNAPASVHNASPLLSATLASPPRHRASEAAIVKRDWRNVPRMSHRRDLHPIWSPMRPREAPKMKERREVRASWSALWKVRSRCPGGPSKRRARAIANCGVRDEGWRALMGGWILTYLCTVSCLESTPYIRCRERYRIATAQHVSAPPAQKKFFF